jgi:hypothetical protein
MAENTKTPPNQDPRQRTPQSDANKPQKPGGSVPSSNPDRGRQGMNNPNKPEIDPDRDRQNRGKPMPSGKPMSPNKDGVVDSVEDIDEDESTQRMDRD